MRGAAGAAPGGGEDEVFLCRAVIAAVATGAVGAAAVTAAVAAAAVAARSESENERLPTVEKPRRIEGTFWRRVADVAEPVAVAELMADEPVADKVAAPTMVPAWRPDPEVSASSAPLREDTWACRIVTLVVAAEVVAGAVDVAVADNADWRMDSPGGEDNAAPPRAM